jgi:prevent-host-death family protein
VTRKRSDSTSGTWQVPEAKSRFSEVVAEAQAHGPQSITKHGKPVAVVLSQRDYERLAQRPRTSLLDFLAASPLAELDLGDRTAVGREVEL